MFKYVRIPANAEEPIEELKASKKGGLEKDELLKEVRAYFDTQAVPAVTATATATASSSSPSSSFPSMSCDIMALTVPVPNNKYRAVSLYSSTANTGIVNDRATQLVLACGHSIFSDGSSSSSSNNKNGKNNTKQIRGDVFVGRAHDNEAFEWVRDDFSIEDADPTAEWCRMARSPGGGGGQGNGSGSYGGSASGASGASSLSSLVQKQLSVMSNQHSDDQNNSNIDASSSGSPNQLYGMDGAPPVVESWGSWKQNADEVELTIVVPGTTKGKDCTMMFHKDSLKISLPLLPSSSSVETTGATSTKPTTILDGRLFGSIDPEDCTYTMESLANGEKEVCVTLVKAERGGTNSPWMWIVPAQASKTATT